MGVVFDILGSFIVRAAIVGMLLQLMITMSDALYRYSEKITLNEDITSVARVISSDLKNAGYHTVRTTSNRGFTIANSSEMKFSIDSTDKIIYIRYYLGSPYPGYPTLSSIFRDSINGAAIKTLEVARNVSIFKFTYYDKNGEPPDDLSKIRSISFNIEMSSKDKLVGVIDNAANVKVQKVSWEQQSFPRNL